MKKTLSLILALVMVAALFVGCGSKKIEEAPAAEGTEQTAPAEKTYKKKLVIGDGNPMTTFDPQAMYDKIHGEMFNLVFNQLVNYNFDTRAIEPELALEWKAEDAQTYWFKLREGVKFSNGEEFTADDVVYTYLERPKIVAPLYQTATFEMMESIDVISDYEIRIHLSEGDADFLTRMYIQTFAINNREACEADPEKGYEIGTGGWMLTELVGSDHASFKRFDSSWVWAENGLTPTEELEFVTMGEASTRLVSLEAGDIVANTDVRLSNYEIVKDNADLDIRLVPAEVLDYMIINMKNGIAADDDNLRMAIAYALDINELNAFAQDGLATRAYTIWGTSQYGYYDAFDNKLENNLDLAKEYLAKSKHPDGCDFQVYVTNNFENYATLVQAQLKKIGVNVVVNVTDKAGMTTVVKEGTHDAIIMSISLQSIGDRFHFVCNPKSSTNRALYENPAMLEKFVAAMAETDDATRMQLYKEIQIELNDVKAYIPFFYEVLVYGAQKDAEGIIWTPDSKPDFTFVRLPE